MQDLRTLTSVAVLVALAACKKDLDTDGDGLSDADEERYGTSALLADTDGDSLTDFEEIIDYGFDPAQDPHKFNPLVADVPKIAFELTSIPTIQLLTTSSTTYGISQSSENASAYTTSRTDTKSHSVEISHTAGVSVSQEINYGPFGFGSTNVELSYQFSQSTTDETSVSFGSESTREMREARETSEQNQATLTGGKLAVLAQIQNVGNLAFTMTGFTLSALQRDPLDRSSSFTPLATLEPESASGFPVRTLGPRESLQEVILSNGDLTVGEVQDLLADPRGLVLQVSSYELTNSEGVAWSHNSTEIAARTATILVDYGPQLGEPERYLVATNVARDDNDQLVGVSVTQALREVLALDYETGEVIGTDANTGEEVGRAQKLRRVGAVEADDAGRAYWVVNTTSKSVDPAALWNFDDLVLKAGDVLHLVYTEDLDDDGLGSREEFLYGTDPNNADTDADGLTDFAEVRTGWPLANSGDQVYPDPTLPDADGDGRTDPEEEADGTNPNVADSEDGTPTDPPTNVPDDEILYLKLDGSLADDTGNEDPSATRAGQYVGDRFGLAASAWDMTYIDGSDDYPLAEISSFALPIEFTFAMWYNGGTQESRMMGKDDGVSLYLEGGNVAFGVLEDLTQSAVDPQDVSPGWALYVGVKRLEGADTIFELYRNGTLVADRTVSNALFADADPTCSLYVGNQRDSGICSGTDRARKLDGTVDDVRVYGRALAAAEIAALYAERGYTP